MCQEFCPQRGGVHTPLGQTAHGQTLPWADNPLDRHPLPHQTATAVDSMHPTEMHSCLNLKVIYSC